MKEQMLTRFKGLQWFSEEKTPVIIGGAGGIGSWLTLLLVRANFRPLVFDNDTVDRVNIGGQLYGQRHVNDPKVLALQQVIMDLCDNKTIIDVCATLYNGATTEYMFSCFDNMEARKQMFEAWCDDPKSKLFIDGRMLAEGFQIYAVTKDRIELYKETLFEDHEVEDELCTARATSHCGAMIAANMVALLTNYIYNEKTDPIRAVPFKYIFDIPLIFNEVDMGPMEEIAE